MIKIFGGGGLGDAAIVIGKILTRFPDKLDEIDVTAIRLRSGVLDKTIQDLYDSQGIKARLKIIGKQEWIPNHLDDYDYFISTWWHGKNQYGTDWEIDPFPPIKYDYKENINTVISPIAGEGTKRKFPQQTINNYLKKYPDSVLIGNMKNNPYKNSMINKTSIKEAVDIIASSKRVIAPEGFVAWLGAMCGKEVISWGGDTAFEKRAHPKWNIKRL